MRMKRKALPVEVKRAVLKKYGRQCYYCGKENLSREELQFEHKTPLCRGGTNDVSNVVISCAKCNQEKGNMTLREYGDLIFFREYPQFKDDPMVNPKAKVGKL